MGDEATEVSCAEFGDRMDAMLGAIHRSNAAIIELVREFKADLERLEARVVKLEASSLRLVPRDDKL